MKKFYAAFFILSPFASLKSQCPLLNGAIINACGTAEGKNEFVVFTTTAQAAASNYVFYYGNATPPKTTPTYVLSGATATQKNGTGVITTGSCTVNYITNSSSIIPAGAVVVLMPSNFDNNYNISTLCTGGTLYMILVDITKAPNVWLDNGSFANSPNAPRYLQITNGANNCATGVRSYENKWTGGGNGDFVSWDAAGTATYTNGGCNLVTPLPVNLVSFTAFAEGKNARIEWASASEISTRSFELERSSDAKSFSKVHTTPAAGNSSGLRQYSYTDLNIPAGATYYRLKMIDINGSSAYSRVAKVMSSRTGFVLTNMYPTPAGSVVNISFNADAAGTTNASIVDITGRQLGSRKLSTNKGMNYHTIPVGSLPTGAYLLKLENNGKVITGQFTKQ